MNAAGKKLSQDEFGQSLGLSRSAIANIEDAENRLPNGVSDSTIKLICATYHVQYLWLTTGEGPMYETASGDALIDKYAPDAEDHLKKVFREMAKLPDSAWESLREYIAYMLAAVDQARDDHAADDS
jgi:transcriptional regulator with XRE-family HTH domain